jgi:hypothetical protein
VGSEVDEEDALRVYFSVLRVYLGRDGVGWVALGAVHCRRFVFSILGVGVDGVVVCLDGGRGCLGNGRSI